MTIKQILPSIFMLGFIFSNNAISSESNSTKAITFKLNSKTFFEKPPVPRDTQFLVEKTGKGEYDFKLIDVDESEKKIAENDGHICLYCPDIKALVLNANNRMDCKNLHLRFLSEQVKALEEENAELKQHIDSIADKTQQK